MNINDPNYLRLRRLQGRANDLARIACNLRRMKRFADAANAEKEREAIHHEITNIRKGIE